MTHYGILLVDTSWANQDTIALDKTAYLHHGDEIGTGTKALIYMREPIDAVVAEAEITGEIVESEAEAPAPVTGAATLSYEDKPNRIDSEVPPPARIISGQELAKSYYVPVKVTRLKGPTPQIRLNRLKTLLGSDFSVFDETWIALSRKQYQDIRAIWDKQKVS